MNFRIWNSLKYKLYNIVLHRFTLLFQCVFIFLLPILFLLKIFFPRPRNLDSKRGRRESQSFIQRQTSEPGKGFLSSIFSVNWYSYWYRFSTPKGEKYYWMRFNQKTLISFSLNQRHSKNHRMREKRDCAEQEHPRRVERERKTSI